MFRLIQEISGPLLNCCNLAVISWGCLYSGTLFFFLWIKSLPSKRRSTTWSVSLLVITSPWNNEWCDALIKKPVKRPWTWQSNGGSQLIKKIRVSHTRRVKPKGLIKINFSTSKLLADNSLWAIRGPCSAYDHWNEASRLGFLYLLQNADWWVSYEDWLSSGRLGWSDGDLAESP